MNMNDELPDFDDVFKLVTIDKNRKKRISVKIIDTDGDEVPFRQTVRQIMKYVEDKLSLDNSDGNQMVNQVMPLVTQAMVSGMPEVMGTTRAAQIMAIEGLRLPLIFMMVLSFSLLKFIQQKNFKIVTIEEDITEEEWDKLIRMTKASEITTLGAMAGISPKEILKELLQKGDLTIDDIKEMTGKEFSPELIGLPASDEDDGKKGPLN
jgi:hypothetical protein